jgi:hypothetical protein
VRQQAFHAEAPVRSQFAKCISCKEEAMKIHLLTAVAGMALAACTSSSGGASNQPTQMTETQRRQDEAVRAFERAAEAQHRATEEQAKAEEAQRKAVEAQKVFAAAQAQALAQSAKAEQAQREARQIEQQEHQRGARAQQHAMRMQKTEARTLQQIRKGNLQRWTETKRVAGTAVDASNDTVLVRSRDRGDVRLKLNSSTAISVEGKQGDPREIQPGSDVRASYQVIDGDPTALKLDVKSKVKATKPRKSSSHGDTGQSDAPEQGNR